MACMDAVRAGRAFRMLRRRQRLRQRDVAERAGVSQQHVSDLERGQLGDMTLDRVTDLFRMLDARVTLTVQWRGGQLDRLLDEAHAAVVEAVCRELRAKGWEVVPELTFAVYREQGSIDVLGWHQPTRTALVVEVKTEIVSLEELLRRHDAKVRLAPSLCRDRFGAATTAVARLLVVADSPTNRRRVAALDAVLRAAYPARGTDVRRWLARPSGALNGLAFSHTARRGARQGSSPGSNGAPARRTAPGGR